MNIVGHFLGEIAVATIASQTLEAGFALGRFIQMWLP